MGQVAEEEKLQFDFNKLKIAGSMGRFPSRVAQRVDFETGWITQLELRFVHPLNAEMDLSLEPKGLASLRTFLARRKEVKLGNQHFDNRFWVKGNKEKVKRLLREDVQKALLKLSANVVDFNLIDESLYLCYEGRVEKPGNLSRAKRGLQSVCGTLHQRSIGNDRIYR